jgi:ribulose 1,5-bisphosphate synthetase/thiazole synthase
MKNWILIFIAALTFLSITDAGRIVINNQPEIKEVYNADIIIYGGTSAAIIAAVEVVKSGKTVLIVSPDQHLGGLTSGGLGFTDTGNKAVIGGLSREFYHRVWLHYKDDAAWNWQNQSDFGNKGQGTVAMDGEFRTMWLFEPHVAEKVF